jgi:DNA-binding GntR family transcriptional regulator
VGTLLTQAHDGPTAGLSRGLTETPGCLAADHDRIAKQVGGHLQRLATGRRVEVEPDGVRGHEPLGKDHDFGSTMASRGDELTCLLDRAFTIQEHRRGLDDGTADRPESVAHTATLVISRCTVYDASVIGTIVSGDVLSDLRTEQTSLSVVARHQTAQGVVTHQLRGEILSGLLPPGTRLLQASVAERMRTSTTPVREAMRELATEGLVDLDAHRGVIVHRATDTELEEVYEIRQMLEPLSIRKTVERITEEELDAADAVCERAEAVTEPGEWVLLNRDFHGTLSEGSRSPELSAILAKLRNRSTLYVALSLREGPAHIRASNEQHRELVNAIRARHAEQAVAIVRAHLGSTVELGHRHIGEQEGS